MRDEYYVTLRGQRYVLYKGLLAMAHERGLASIDTEVIQIPTADNGNVAVVKAVVTLSDIEEEAVIRHRHFSGIGDASPDNVSKQMVPHILRMAETRGKARALRDAIAEGVTALEELSDEASDEAPAKPAPSTIGEKGATQLYKHMLSHGWSSKDVGEYEESHKPLDEHTDEEGRKLWKSVKGGVTA